MKASRSALFFLILGLVASEIIIAVGFNYGEGQSSLGQFVDDFDDLNNVSARHFTNRNATFNAMELETRNLTNGNIMDIWTGFTEVDPVGDQLKRINDTSIWFDNVDRDQGDRIYRDYGANFFDRNFSYTASVRISSTHTLNARAFYMGFSDSENDFYSIIAAGGQFVSLKWFHQNADNEFHAILQVNVNSTFNYQADVGETEGLNLDTWYWIRFEKIDNFYNASFYLDKAMTNLDFNLNVTDIDDSISGLRYFYPLNSEARETGNRALDCWINTVRNDTLTEGFSPDGYFITTDYLTDPLARGASLVLMTNATVPASGNLTVEFSSNNSTWVNSQGVSSFDQVEVGFNSLDLRDLNYSNSIYLRYNFTTTDHRFTPRLYQSRLITTIGNQSFLNTSGVWTYFNMSQVTVETGTLDSGNLGSLAFVDGNQLNVSEVVGVPGMRIFLNASGIPSNSGSVWLVMRTFYDGSSTHVFDVEMWNFTGASFESVTLIPDQTDWEWINGTRYDLRIPEDYIRSGNVRVCLHHESAGNINHDVSIEYMQILANLPVGRIATITIYEDLTPFLAIAIILSLIVYLLTRSL